MSNKLSLLVILLLFASFVSAVPHAKCVGNVLEYYDLGNDVVKRDCSVLHASNGLVFRGICKSYNGGQDADCWRTGGNVTFDYMNTVSEQYNLSDNGWGSPYIPPSPVVTTTTIVASPLQCPVCQSCGVCENCTHYRTVISSLNSTIVFYKNNADAYKAESDSKIDKVTYMSVLDAKDKAIQMSDDINAKCMKDKADVESWNTTYMAVAAISVLIMVLVVYIWVKYEFYGGPKVEDMYIETRPKQKK